MWNKQKYDNKQVLQYYRKVNSTTTKISAFYCVIIIGIGFYSVVYHFHILYWYLYVPRLQVVHLWATGKVWIHEFSWHVFFSLGGHSQISKATDLDLGNIHAIRRCCFYRWLKEAEGNEIDALALIKYYYGNIFNGVSISHLHLSFLEFTCKLNTPTWGSGKSACCYVACRWIWPTDHGMWTSGDLASPSFWKKSTLLR